MSQLTLEPMAVNEDEMRLTFGGDLDLATLAEAEAALTLAEARHPRRLVLDLRRVELIDSSGLRLLVDAERRARRQGRTFAVAAVPGGPVHRLLRLTLLIDHVFVLADPGDDIPPTGDAPPPQRQV